MFNNFFGSIRDYLENRLEDLRSFLDFSDENEDGEEEFFDETPTINPSDIQDEIADIEQELDKLDNEPEPDDTDAIQDLISELRDGYISELEPLEIDIDPTRFFPDWISQSDVERIIDQTGVADYDDLTDAEKDDLLGDDWRGFDEADEPAEDITNDDLEKFRDELGEQLNIPSGVLAGLSEDELIVISTISETEIGLMREFDDLTPDEVAEVLGATYRGSFDSWNDLINSTIWEFILERPDLFDIYQNEDGEIEIYEVYQ